METAYLETFLLVVECGSMSEAARRLDLSPAAVAQQLQVLERKLGAPLLQRAGRTVRPTETGHRCLDQVRTVLGAVDNLRTAAREDDGAMELRLGTINTALYSLLPEVLEALVRAHPQAKVQVHSGLSNEIYDALQRDELDVAICLYPPYALPKTVRWELLREEPLVLMAPARWAGRDPLELLRTEPLIRYDRALGGGRAADRYLRERGIVPAERFELNSLAAIAMLVDRGLGVSLIPHVASPWWPGLDVALLALPEKTQARRFGVAWQTASIRRRTIERFLVQVRGVVGAT